MLIYMRYKSRRGTDHGGWLVLEHGERNVFHLDDGTMTAKQVQQQYGGLVKGEFVVTASQWSSYLTRLGVKQSWEEPE